MLSEPGDVVDALLDCHARIRRFLELAQAIARGDHHSEAQIVEACERCERYLVEALPLHIEDEEQSIERRMRGLHPDVDEALDAMHRQHGEHEEVLREVVDRLRAVQSSPTNRSALAALADAARQLEALMEEHLDVEERVLFPAMRALLPPTAQDELLAEIRARRARM